MATYTRPRIIGSSVNVYSEVPGKYLCYQFPGPRFDWANDTGSSNNNWLAVSYNAAAGYAARLSVDTSYATNPSTAWYGSTIMSSTASNTKKWVINLQYTLHRLGYLSSYSDVDGSFGPNTKAAVMAFQSDEGITVDGKVGSTTKQHLVSALISLG